MFCKHCGAQLTDSKNFCPNCGTQLSTRKKKKAKKKMPLFLRIIVIILTLIIVIPATLLCVAILGDSSDPQSEYISSTTDQIDSALVDNNSIKVSFVGAQDASSLGVFYVTLKIENKTDSDITVNLEDADVDGETIPLITTGVPLVIRPGNSGQTGFIFSMVNLSISSMDEAENATFRVVARDNDSYNVIYESELITVDLH